MEPGVADDGAHSGTDERITRLHDVATELQTASEETVVFEAIIEAAVQILGFDACAVSVPDGDWFDERAVSDSAPFEVGTRSHRLDEGLIGKSFQTGETIILDDASESQNAKASHQEIVSGISVPLGDKGVFQGYASEVGAFDESDAMVADLLCAHATAALDRIERERMLKQKNEQLEDFASFVSHDLRNPLNVATLRLELAQTEFDSDHLEDATQALDRMETLIDELLTLAQAGRQVNHVEPVDLSALAETCWKTVTTGDATLVIETDQTVFADRSRLRQLLENLFRNAIEHAVPDETSVTADLEDGVDHGDTLTITVGPLENGGFYVADDGPGIPEDQRERVFERGYSTAPNGTGFGLAIIEEIVEAHDWSITVVESDGGGARFEIRT